MADRFDTLKFLEEYQRFPCLWKKNCADFKNRVKRDHAEEVLLPLSGLPSVKELKQKIRSIRCTYNQEVSKRRKSMGTGSGASQVHQPKLAWFAMADSFLRQNSEENESESNLANLDKKQEQEASTESTEIIEGPEEITISTPQAARSTKVQTPQKRNRHKRAKLDDSLDSAVEALRHVANQTTANEFATFGQHVAAQLQCLPLHEALKLQEGIQSLITSVRLRSAGADCSSSTPNSARPESRDTYAPDTIYYQSDDPFSPEGEEENISSFYINWTDNTD